MLHRERLAASGALLLLCIAAAAPLASAAIDWRPCPDDWYTGDYADTREYIDCAQLPVPLSYRDPEGEQLELWLTRVHPAGGAPPEAEVWALQGGPGDPATAIVPLFLSLVRDGRLNVTGVMPELRGVGGASRLLCSNGAPADLAVCPEEVAANRSYLSHFVLDNAARDVAAALREAGEPEAGIPRILYALSAGTLWANKIFVLEPNVTSLLDAVVLDSVVHPAAASVVSYDHNADQVDQQWLEQCALDPDCGPHWPGGLVRTWQAVLQSIQNNSNACVAANWPWLGGRQGADRLRVALKMVSASWWGRPLAPAVIWRLDRCSPQDVAELDAWMATNGLDSSEAAAAPVNVTIAGLIGPWGHNMLVQDIVTFNDWTAPSATQGLNVSSPADLHLIQAAADAWQAASLQGINYVTGLLRDKFPLLWKSEEAGIAGKVADIRGIPVVILSGTGDNNTPNRFAQQLVSEHPQYLLLPFENAGHVVMMLEADPELRGCMEELLSQVLARIQAGEEVSTQTVDAQMCAPGTGGMPRIDWAARSNRTRAVLESMFVYPAAAVDGA